MRQLLVLGMAMAMMVVLPRPADAQSDAPRASCDRKELAAALSDTKADIVRLKGEIKKAGDEGRDLQKKYDAAAKANKDAIRKWNDLDAQQHQARDNRHADEEDMELLEKAHESRQQVIKDKQDQVAQPAKTPEERDRLKQQIQQLKQEDRVAGTQHSSDRKKIAAATKKIAGLEEDKKKAFDTHFEAEKAMSKLKIDLDVKRGEFEDLKKQLAALNDEVKEQTDKFNAACGCKPEPARSPGQTGGGHCR